MTFLRTALALFEDGGKCEESVEQIGEDLSTPLAVGGGGYLSVAVPLLPERIATTAVSSVGSTGFTIWD
jgi:hypothetical protein